MKALAENEDIDSVLTSSPPLPVVAGPDVVNLNQPLVIKIDAEPQIKDKK